MSVVSFSEVEEFLADLAADRGKVQCARIEYVLQEVNDGLTQVFVKCGFMVKDGDEHELRELQYHCGDDKCSDVNGSGEGTVQSQDLMKYLRERIEALEVEVRGGSYS